MSSFHIVDSHFKIRSIIIIRSKSNLDGVTYVLTFEISVTPLHTWQNVSGITSTDVENFCTSYTTYNNVHWQNNVNVIMTNGDSDKFLSDIQLA